MKKKTQQHMNLVDSLLAGYGTVHNMNDEILSDWMVTILFGGYDTTALAVAYTLYLLAKHSHIQEICAKEAQQVLGCNNFDDDDDDIYINNNQDDNNFCSYDIPKKYINDNIDVQKDCPYIWACVWEALRLYPPVTIVTRNLDRPFSFEMHFNDEEDEKQQQQVEEEDVEESKPNFKTTTTTTTNNNSQTITLNTGTRIVCSIYWIHRTEKNFPKPNEYLPQRWVQLKTRQNEDSNDKNETTTTTTTTTTTIGNNISDWEERTKENDLYVNDSNMIPVGNRSLHLAFSAGGRNCVGQALGCRMVSTIVTILVRSFYMELQDPNYEITLTRYGANAAPVGGIPMKFSPRRKKKIIN